MPLLILDYKDISKVLKETILVGSCLYILHGIRTFLICAFFVDFQFAFILGILDMFLHWQIDFCKTRLVIAYNLNNTQRKFWWLQAVDQILHYSTYILIVGLISWAEALLVVLQFGMP